MHGESERERERERWREARPKKAGAGGSTEVGDKEASSSGETSILQRKKEDKSTINATRSGARLMKEPAKQNQSSEKEKK